ncbi:hypothetical protein AAKU52_002031 [Pedobacter sp. CG_S7]|uniref:hypothetical protein n=1 Tax=Pedobacter sp. CG_S7 TaxID=3143930 RepID=UPI00339A77A5
MENSGFTRRNALKITAVLGTALLKGIDKVSALSLTAEKTPPLSASKIASIETALSKKGTRS